MKHRDIGAIGENLFLSWCEPEGFRAQKSQVDRLGWDFLLEHEPKRAADRPLDGQNDLPKFLIQVKATEKVGTPPRIKLSALKHLVDTDLPSAILIMFFRKDGRQPVRSLLVPVDKYMIADTLRRVRQKESDGSREIHKITVSVPVDRAKEIGVLGDGLRNSLFGMLDGDSSDYIAGKIRFRRSCGYDGQAVVGRFFVPGRDALQRVNELFLGGPREIGVKDLTIEHRRFGIALDSDRQHFKDAVLSMDVPPTMPAFLEISAASGETVSVETGFWAPSPFGGRTGSRVRFANSYLELIFDFENGVANFTLDYGGRRTVDIEDAVSIVEVGSILALPERMITVRFGSAKAEFPFACDESPFRNWIAAAPVLRRILSVVSRFPRLKREVQLDEFSDWGRAAYRIPGARLDGGGSYDVRPMAG